MSAFSPLPAVILLSIYFSPIAPIPWCMVLAIGYAMQVSNNDLDALECPRHGRTLAYSQFLGFRLSVVTKQLIRSAWQKQRKSESSWISKASIPVVPGQAGGGSFKEKTISQRKNLPIECAQGDRPARCPNHVFAVNEPSAVPWWWCDLFWCHEVACGVRWSNVLGCEVTWGELLWLVATWPVMSCHLMCWSCHLVRWAGHVMSLDVLQSTTPVPLQHYSVLQSTTPVLLWLPSSAPVLLCTTKYYSSTALYYKVLLQYYSVLRSTTPVLLCTTKYYSSTTLYYEVLLQYYSVLQSTTPVPLCTTKYYKVLLQYYKVLLKYHSVPQSTVLLQYYSVLQSTTPVLLWLPSTAPVLQSTTPVLLCTKYYSSTTLYYKVLLQYCSVLQSTTPLLLCTTKYYSSTTLYYKGLLQYYSVLQSTTPVLLRTTKYYSSTTKYYSSTTLYYKVLLRYYSVLQSTTPLLLWNDIYNARSNKSHHILRVPRKMNLMIDPHRIWNVIYNVQSKSHHRPTSPNTACHAKWISWLIRITYETSFTMRGATGITLQPHQILRLPCKMNLMIDRAHIWNVISNAQSSKSHPPTSPNTAPATQNESHDWSASHMKRHLQCAEQQASTSNLTKYCACHAKWISWLIRIAYETSFTMCRARAITVQPHQILRLPRKMNVIPSNFTRYCACHAKWISWLIRITYETSFTMCRASAITVQPHQILRLPRKMNVMIDRAHIWNVISNAQSSKSHPPTSPDTAPATQNESHDWSASHMKRHLQCAEQQASPSNLTKYCACHAKWMSWLIVLTYETSFPMRRAARVTLQLHQILRLPRKMNLMIDPHRIWNVIYNVQSKSHHRPTSPNTAPATQNESHDWSA